MWYDRLLDISLHSLPARVDPGRYLTDETSLSLNNHSELQEVLVSDGSEQGVLVSKDNNLDDTKISFVMPGKSMQVQTNLLCNIIETLDVEMRGEIDCGELCSPLMPATIITEKSHLLPFEKKLLEVIDKGHLHQISLRPRLDLLYSEELTNVARARRLAKGALVHLASHSECWQRQTLNGVIPKKIMARFSEDDYNIYENIVYARLLDNIEAHLHERIETLKQLQATLACALTFYETTNLDHRLTAAICTLWGQTFDSDLTSEAVALLEETLYTLKRLLKSITGLKQNGVYLLVHRQIQVGSTLHLTNILSHDAHYRYLIVLWDLLNKVKNEIRKTQAETFQHQQYLAYAYSRYAGLALRHALLPYMEGKTEAHWAGRKLELKQSGMEWRLILSGIDSGRAHEDTLLTLIPWLGLQERPEEARQVSNSQEKSCRIIAWPALDVMTNCDDEEDATDVLNRNAVIDHHWIALSPFDLYCVERFGWLVDSILTKQLVKNHGTPLKKIPTKAMNLASENPCKALKIETSKSELVIRYELPVNLLTDLQQQLLSDNAKSQVTLLERRQVEIQALQHCPVCQLSVALAFQPPAGFKANCRNCKTERYFRKNTTDWEFEQKLDGQIDFRTTGRRTFTLSSHKK